MSVLWGIARVALVLASIFMQGNEETTDSTPSFTNISSNVTTCHYTTNESLTSSDKGKFNYGTN